MKTQLSARGKKTRLALCSGTREESKRKEMILLCSHIFCVLFNQNLIWMSIWLLSPCSLKQNNLAAPPRFCCDKKEEVTNSGAKPYFQLELGIAGWTEATAFQRFNNETMHPQNVWQINGSERKKTVTITFVMYSITIPRLGLSQYQSLKIFFLIFLLVQELEFEAPRLRKCLSGRTIKSAFRISIR